MKSTSKQVRSAVRRRLPIASLIASVSIALLAILISLDRLRALGGIGLDVGLIVWLVIGLASSIVVLREGRVALKVILYRSAQRGREGDHPRPTLLAWDCAHRDAAIAGRPAFAGSCIFASIPAPALVASALRQSEQLAAAGQIEEAERLADHLVSEHPDVGATHALRGILFRHAGRPADAVASWQRGLADSQVTLGCYFLIARLRHQQAREGPTVQHAFGMVKVSPSQNAEDPGPFRSRMFAEAADALTRALTLQPADVGIKAWLATIQHEQGEHGSAKRLWRELVDVDPHHPYFALGLGQSLMACGEAHAAAEAFERATAGNPRLAEAWKGLALARQLLGEHDRANASEAQAEFFAWLPPFIALDFSDDSYRKVRVLRSPGDAQPERADLLRKLSNDPSRTAAALLAALCWHHCDHGAVEEQVFATLEQRGGDAVPLFLALFRHAASRCTQIALGKIFSRSKVRAAVETLGRFLPFDTDPVWIVDAAGALAAIGDARAVPFLTGVLAPGSPSAPESSQDPMRTITSRARLANRLRCALSLAAFDVAESRAALEAGCNVPELAAFCHAALWRMTGDSNGHREAIVEALPRLHEADRNRLIAYVQTFPDDSAWQLLFH